MNYLQLLKEDLLKLEADILERDILVTSLETITPKHADYKSVNFSIKELNFRIQTSCKGFEGLLDGVDMISRIFQEAVPVVNPVDKKKSK